MDLIDQLRALATRIEATKNLIQTEEATKNSMIMPFIQSLGYNVFDPTEVTPELIADIGTKKGEKVDYAILKDSKPIIIFECKKAGVDLNINHASQLFRYFHVTEARFAVLTNGLIYQFFTDLEQPNKMDAKPFLEFNLLDFKDQEISELKKFAKSSFNIDTILATANDLKYTRYIKNLLEQWLYEPSEEFIKLLCTDLLNGKRFNSTAKEQFTPIVSRAFQNLINDQINDRLQGVMLQTKPAANSTHAEIDVAPEVTEPEKEAAAPITTQEEIDGYNVIKAILRDVIPPQRITLRDAQSYCAILLDDNNRKPICRLRFNNTNRLVLGLFNDKDEEKIPLESIDSIFSHAERLRSTALAY
ncbi:MAG: type I restriction endonuclease [Thiolinea sp.]